MLVRTDDEVYRVDAVWLGPPRATFPWRARYVSYGLGLFVMVFLMFVQRRLGIGLDFFSIAWSLIATVLITRFLGKRIDYERPLGQIITLFKHEVTGPRPRAGIRGGLVHAGHVAVRVAGARGVSSARSPRGAAKPRVVKAAKPGRAKKTGPRATTEWKGQPRARA